MKIEEFATFWKDAEHKGTAIYLKDFHLCLVRLDLEVYQVYSLFQGNSVFFSRKTFN